MLKPQARWFSTLGVVIGLVFPINAHAQPLDTLIEWNRVMQVTVAGTATPTVFFTRAYALTGIAVFDALNSIDRVYRPYVVEVTASPSAGREAAIAQAAHDVLVALYPGQRVALDAALATSLRDLPARPIPVPECATARANQRALRGGLQRSEGNRRRHQHRAHR
jgi:hypothetical protein